MLGLAESETIIRKQLELYEEQADAWRKDHDRASKCLELEALTGFGLHLFGLFRRIDDKLSKAVLQKESAFDENAARQLAAWYADWLEPCQSVLREVNELEAEGFKIDRADEFRRACHEARAILSIPLDRVLAVSKRLERGEGNSRPAGDPHRRDRHG